MHKLAQPVKLSYAGPFFRHERPQAGRYRQFHQIGAEAIGSDSPLADAEAIVLLADLLAELGVPGVELRLGSLGSLDARARLPGGAEGPPARQRGRALRGRPRADRRQPAARLRLRRRGDARRDGGRADDRRAARGRGRRALRRGPRAARRRRGRVRDRPDPRARPRLLHADDLLLRLRPARRPVRDRRRRPLRRPDRAARRAADAGGRLGGGIERILLALGEEAETPAAPHVFISPSTRARTRRGGTALALAGELRRAGLGAEVDLAGRSAKGQFKHANRIGADLRRDPRGRTARRSCATWRAASRSRCDAADAGRRDRAEKRHERAAAAASANAYRDTWCGEVLGERVDSEARVAGWVHRRRDHGGLIFIDLRDRTGLVQLVFHPDTSGEAFELAHRLRAEDVLSAAGSGRAALRGDGQPRAAHRRVRARGRRRRAALRRRHAALPDRGLLRRGRRGRPPAPPLPRPAPRADARGARAAPPGHRGDARVPRRGGLPRCRDAGPDPLDPRGRARLPRPQPPPAGLLLRAAPVAAALQAAADGRRLRALLPDRPLLPRRGPARRPPARLHPARRRDVLRRASTT